MNIDPPTVDEKEKARVLTEALDGRPRSSYEACEEELEVVGLLNTAFHSELKADEVERQLNRLLIATSDIEKEVAPWWRGWLLPLGTAVAAGVAGLIWGIPARVPEPTQLPVPTMVLLVAESKRTQNYEADVTVEQLWREYDEAVMDTLISRYQGAAR